MIPACRCLSSQSYQEGSIFLVQLALKSTVAIEKVREGGEPPGGSSGDLLWERRKMVGQQTELTGKGPLESLS